MNGDELDRLPEYRDESGDHRYFTQVPNIVLDYGLSDHALKLYLRIKRIAGEHGAFKEARRTTCEAIRISPSSLDAGRKELVEAGFISAVMVGEAGTQRYICTILDIWERNVARYRRGAGSPENRSDTTGRGGRFSEEPVAVPSEYSSTISEEPGGRFSEEPEKERSGKEPGKEPVRIPEVSRTGDGNLYARYIDEVRRLGKEPPKNGWDAKLINTTDMEPELIAQAWCALQDGLWGARWPGKSATLKTVIGSMGEWLNRRGKQYEQISTHMATGRNASTEEERQAFAKEVPF